MLRASLGTALALLGVLGATVAGTLTANASPASAPPDTFTVAYGAVYIPDQLTEFVDSASTITGLTASLMSGTNDEYDAAMTLVSSETDPVDRTQTRTEWQATIPEGTSPSGLAPGSYAIKLTATYSDSSTSSVTPGTFAFLVQPTVTLAASDTTLTYGNASTALSGTVTLADPNGSPDTDYTGLSVNIISNGQVAETLPLSSTGTFSDPAFTPAEGAVVVAQVAATATLNTAESAAVDISVIPATPTLTLKVNPVTENYGQAVTVTGTLIYTSGSTSIPVAGHKIWIGNQPDGTSPLVTGTTGSDGSFSSTLPAQQVGATLYVGSTSQANLNAVETPLQLNVVNHPTIISGFKVSLDQYWDLSVSGCLESGNTAQGFHHTSGLTVQYASSANGPWTKLGSINGNEPDNTCGTGGIKFTGSFTAPENYASYRVVYAGTSSTPTSYASTTSPSILTWRYYDRITALKVSPTVVNAGGKLTIAGTLQNYYSGWHNYSGQIIYIDFHPKGSNPWYWLLKVKTNSKGRFSATFKDPVSATWQAVFSGNNNGGGHLSAGSAEVYVRLK
jgi:hypothetical protein